MDREELIATATKIAELRKEIARLGGLQKELKQLETLIDTMTGVTPSAGPARRRGSFSLEEKIGQFLEERAEKEWTAEEIHQKLDIHVPTVRASLSKLRKSGRIIDTRRGYVQAKSAEPSTPKEDDSRLMRVA